MKNLYQILVFKTNIKKREDIKKITAYLTQFPTIKNWSVDRKDCDCVLRIESAGVSTLKIIEIIRQNGYFCEELL